MKTQAYLDLKDRQQKEISDFPIAYAFNEEQLKEALVKLGAEKEECVTIFGHGDIVKKENAKPFIEMLKRHTQEVKDKLADDKGFAEAAFLYEMNNHEYCINWDGDDDVLACFGLDFEELDELGLRPAYNRARREHMRIAHEEWDLMNNGVIKCLFN